MWSYVNYNINEYSKRERNVMRIVLFLKGLGNRNQEYFYRVLLLKKMYNSEQLRPRSRNSFNGSINSDLQILM